MLMHGPYPKTRAEIERIVLNELQSVADCGGAVGVSIVPFLDAETGANWTVACYDVGTANHYACDAAMQQIVPRMQGFYELVQKH
ncbi:MAG TPA: hypothetical protein VNR11_19965 [Xanthobacteraceae bacterium]|nr:hypothetical protein [Xanthobacteraceae bacterium]